MTTERDNPDLHAAINELVGRFYAAFDNRSGRVINVRGLREMFLPEAVIVRANAAEVETMNVDTFIVSRERMLSDGSLINFHEWETSATTQVLRGIACRHSTYAKSGIFSGEPYDGSGAKLIQLVRTQNAWRIAAIAWQDD